MWRYAIALGSNRRHGRHGAPRAVIEAALRTLAEGTLLARSPVIASPALGPAGRAFANAAAVIESPLSPPDLLARLKAIERAFGRRRGRRWGARVIDLDILLWSGGGWRRRDLTIPHPALAQRAFVLVPLATIAPHWRAPDGLAVRHLRARLSRPRPGAPD